jgi:hypothetical protein
MNLKSQNTLDVSLKAITKDKIWQLIKH